MNLLMDGSNKREEKRRRGIGKGEGLGVSSPLKVRACSPMKVRTCSPLKVRACNLLKVRM